MNKWFEKTESVFKRSFDILKISDICENVELYHFGALLAQKHNFTIGTLFYKKKKAKREFAH